METESIFEKSVDDELMDLEKMLETIDEEEDEVEEVEEVEEVVRPDTPPPKRKGRKPLSDERKAALRAQLQKGRASSLAKRKNNAKLRKLKKAKQIVADEVDIVLSTKSNSELQNEIKLLKQQMKNGSRNLAESSSVSLSVPEKTTKVQVLREPAQPPKPVHQEQGPPKWLLKEMNYKSYY
tara:strand:+ start:61 stop:603 length:543 start_codon:yes stop_codon:yes gene_type:complete